MNIGNLYLDAKKYNQLELEVLIHFLISNKYQSFKDDVSVLNKYFSERHRVKMNGIMSEQMKRRQKAFKTFLIDNKTVARSRSYSELQYELNKHKVKYKEILMTFDDFYKLDSIETEDGEYKDVATKIEMPNETTLLGKCVDLF